METSRVPVVVAVSVLCTFIVLACGDAGGESDAPDARPAPASATTPASSADPLPDEPTGPVDTELARAGEQLFSSRGCVACHYVGGEARLVGPDLLGVTERRSFPWFFAMVTNPDSMVREDPDARELFAEYMTPMSNQGVTPDEVVRLWEYLRAADQQP